MDTINKKMQMLKVEKDNVTNLMEQAKANEKQTEDCYKELGEEQQCLQKNLKGTGDDIEEYLKFMNDIVEKLEQEDKDTVAEANVVSIKCLIWRYHHRAHRKTNYHQKMLCLLIGDS
uniref:Uncharacterized protein n=1 Tax=Piliocolobus tephrosceles TaxID=591936 RepID=A0A8C9LRU4_9PRIM